MERVVDPIAQVEEAERTARAQRGLSQWHVLDLKEFPFAFALPALDALAARVPEIVEAQGRRKIQAALAIARKDYAAANTLYAELQREQPENPLWQMRLGHDAPETDVCLPPVAGSYPSGPAIFVGCSGDYLREFGIPLLRSIAAQREGTPVHLHVMYRDDESLRRVMGLGLPLRITHTYENPMAFIKAYGLKAGEYYGSMRLIRFAEALAASSGPLCLTDCDALMVGDPQRLFDIPGDIALRVRPGRMSPENQFSTCLVVARPGALTYFQRVARIVKSLLLRNSWGFDQFALFSAWLVDQPALTLLGPEAADVEFRPGSLVWYTAGKAKTQLLTDPSPYAQLFRRYRAMGQPGA